MDSLFIHNATSISPQGFFPALEIQNALFTPENFSAKEPSYKEVLPGNMVRRMAKITKMAVMCGLSLSQENTTWDAIIAATGMGNLADTEKFIKTYNQSRGGLVPPTSFTQSSHNTVAGQIALFLKNHGYNMAHVQQGFSFENALVDAQLQIQNGLQNVLVGAADEHIPFLNQAAQELQFPQEIISTFGEGASFFHIAKTTGPVALIDVAFAQNISDPQAAMQTYLASHGLNTTETYVVHATALGTQTFNAQVHIADFTGRHFTNSALGLHVAASAVLEPKNPHAALVVNTDHRGKISFILVKRV